MEKSPKIVCLGGGIGTMNLLKGLRNHFSEITVVVSMADDGGSAGRLRRLYNVQPPGDIISCFATLINNSLYSNFLKYRFPGDRYGKDEELGGQKLGNLMLVAAQEVTGSFEEGIALMKKIFNVPANILPATDQPVVLHAKTIDGRTIHTEEKIDLGNYEEPRILEEIWIDPKDAKTPQSVLDALDDADCIIAGPGDLYTNVLPVLVVPAIAQKLKEIQKTKIFVVNIANKPFETRGYFVSDFLKAINKHLDAFPFDKVVINNNTALPIPEKYHYTYVDFDEEKTKTLPYQPEIIQADLVAEDFPLYHNSQKLTETIVKIIS